MIFRSKFRAPLTAARCLAPSSTPPALVEQLARDIATVAGKKTFSKVLMAQGAVPATLSPAEFTAFVRVDPQAKSIAVL